MVGWDKNRAFAGGSRLLAMLACFLGLLAGETAVALPVPYISVEGDVQKGQSLGSTWDITKAKFVYQAAFMPIEFRYLPSTTLKDANGNARAFPQWAKQIIDNEVLLDWQGGANPVRSGTQVMNEGLAAGEKGRYFDPAGEEEAFHAAYTGVSFQNVGPQAAANISFVFEDFGNAVIDAFLRDNAWPGKPAGPWEPWSLRTADLDKNQNGAITGAKDKNGNPIPIPVDGLLGVWIPEQITLQNKTLFALPHDFAGDTILFNSKVNWNMTTEAPANDQLDFYHVALHEVGHGLGFNHAIPEPTSLLLVGIGLALLLALDLSRLKRPSVSPAPKAPVTHDRMFFVPLFRFALSRLLNLYGRLARRQFLQARPISI